MRCKECGKEYKPRILDEFKKYEEHCFDCSFWLSKIDSVDDPNQIIVEGHCFRVGSAPDAVGGFCKEFRIVRFDGTELITSNLWHNGKVDDRFRDRLKDNAVFVPVKKINNVPASMPF